MDYQTCLGFLSDERELIFSAFAFCCGIKSGWKTNVEGC